MQGETPKCSECGETGPFLQYATDGLLSCLKCRMGTRKKKEEEKCPSCGELTPSDFLKYEGGVLSCVQCRVRRERHRQKRERDPVEYLEETVRELKNQVKWLREDLDDVKGRLRVSLADRGWSTGPFNVHSGPRATAGPLSDHSKCSRCGTLITHDLKESICDYCRSERDKAEKLD